MPDLLGSAKKLGKKIKSASKKASSSISKHVDKLAKGGRLPTPDTPALSVAEAWPWSKKAWPWYVQWWRSFERISIVEDDGGEKALRFDLTKGCHGLASGAAFRANPHMCLPADAATLSYSVYFPPDFDWVKGGKLPGVNIGSSPMDCSTGGAWSTTGGSFRIMFREHGAAIGYVYMPIEGAGTGAFAAQTAEFQAVGKVKGSAGIDLWHSRDGSDMQLRAGEWNDVSMSVVLNTPGEADGAVVVTVNGVTKSLDGVVFRPEGCDCSHINAVNFVVFFGGGSDDWNSPVDTYCLFKDISFAAA